MDIRTLFVAIAVSDLAFAVGIFLYVKGQHSVHHSIEIWGRSRLLAGLGMLLQGMRGIFLPVSMVAIAANALIFTAIILSVVAFKSCLDKPALKTPSDGLVFIGFAILWTLLMAFGIPENIRLAFFSLFLSSALFVISKDLAIGWRGNSALQKFMAILTPLFALASIMRGGEALVSPPEVVFSRDVLLLAGMFIGFIEAITTSFGFLLLAKERTDRELELQAGTDHLTGLPNRRSFYSTAEKLFSLEKRAGQPISLLLLDIDHFKTINDRSGHDVGDMALQAFAGILRSTTRQCDFLVRLGGEEFGVLMPDTSADSAVDAAERIRNAVENWQKDGIRMTVSIGIYGEEEASSDLDMYFSMADAALYRAKETGRNRVELQPIDMHFAMRADKG